MATTYTKRLRAWFFTTVGDTQINGWWTRFVGGGVSKPSEETMSDLVASAAFHTEVASAAQVDTVAALQDKQGLVIIASDSNAKSGTNTALGSTGGKTVVQPSQLPTAESGTSDFTVTTVAEDGANSATQDPFELIADVSTTTRNRYILKFKAAFVKWILRRTLPSGGTTGQAIVKTSGTDYDYGWGTVAAGSTGDIFKTTSVSSIDPSIIALGANAVFTVPAGLAYTIGQTVRVYSTGTPTKQLFGTVVSYSGTTLTLKKVYSAGSGASTDWQINVSPTEFPDYTGITAKSGLKVIDGVLLWDAEQTVSGVPNLYIDGTNGVNSLDAGTILKPFLTLDYCMQRIDATGPFVGLGALTNKQIVCLNGNLTTASNIYRNTINMSIEASCTITYTGTNYLFDNTSSTVSNILRVVGNGVIVSSGIGGLFKIIGSSSGTKKQLVLEGVTIRGNSVSGRVVPLIIITGYQAGGWNFYATNCQIASTQVTGTPIHGTTIYLSDSVSCYLGNCVVSAGSDFKSAVFVENCTQSFPRFNFISTVFTGSSNGMSTIARSLLCLRNIMKLMVIKDCIFQCDSSSTVQAGLWLFKDVAALNSDFIMDGCVFSKDFGTNSIICSTDESLTANNTVNNNILLGFNKRGGTVIGTITAETGFNNIP